MWTEQWTAVCVPARTCHSLASSASRSTEGRLGDRCHFEAHSRPGRGLCLLPGADPALAPCWSHVPVAQHCPRDGSPRDRGLAFARRCRPAVGDSGEVSSSEHISIRWQRFLTEVKLT